MGHTFSFAPKAQGEEYVNRKHTLSFLPQGTTDNSGRFVDVCTGYSGKNYDVFVFKESTLMNAMDAGTPPSTWGGVSLLPLIVAD